MDPIEPVFNVDLATLVDPAPLGEVFDQFVGLFHLPIRLFDENDNLLIERSLENAVCHHVGTQARGRNQCLVIRQRVKAANPLREGETRLVVPCFCGFEYMIFPISFESRPMGKLAIGPYFPKELERIPDSLKEVAPTLDQGLVKTSMAKLPRYARGQVARFCRTLAAVVDCIFFSVHKANVTAQMHTATVREAYREITEKNRKLEEMVEERKEFDRQKSNFLAMVSHELRTPLTSIIGYSDMLSEGIAGEMTEEQLQFAHTIRTKGDELLRIISSILDFSKVDSGRITVEATPTNVADVIARAIEKESASAQRRGVEIKTKIPDPAPVVQMDPEKIATAVTHLIDNAVKFSVPGGRIEVSAQVMASEENDAGEDGFGFVLLAVPDMLEITVEDFGIGIETDDVDILFAPFTQADESSTREHGGAGMGLAIVKQYVEAHGGRVVVSSRKGEGSRFSIRLPMLAGAPV